MKWIFLLSLFIFVSCGQDQTTIIPANAVTKNNAKGGNLENDMIIHIIDVQNEVTLDTSIDENSDESDITDFETTTEGTYLVEAEIPVLSGNSGKSWLALTIGNRKFCYKGNASNAATPDGDKFILKHELSDANTNCNEDQDEIDFNREVEISFHVNIKLEIEKGGCAVGRGACMETTVSTVLLLLE